jgi:hypothetical protein
MLQPPDPALAEEDRPITLSYQRELETELIAADCSAIFREIDRLEEGIFNSNRLPLTGKTMVNEEELLGQIDIIRSSIPKTLKIAHEILEYKHQIIQEAQQQARELIAAAHHQAYEIANELGIIDRAQIEAGQIRQITIAECDQLRQQTAIEIERNRDRHRHDIQRMRDVAIQECQQIQAGADEYADRVLSDMEFQLNGVLQVIQRGRKQLNQVEESSASAK